MEKDNNDDNEVEPIIPEPEDCVSNAKYLIELIQMDLNFGRVETIPARAEAAYQNIGNLCKLFPLTSVEGNNEKLLLHFAENGWTEDAPTEVGLFGITSEAADYIPSYVAVTEYNGELYIHDISLPKKRKVSLYCAEHDGLLWKFLI